MSGKEFDLIEQFFGSLKSKRDDVVLGIGDDAALLCVPPEKWLVDTTDTLVAGVHFFEEASPHAIGYKCLAVNLSDLAAMGATPCWVSLAITLPSFDVHWLTGFTQGFASLLDEFGLALIGGDTTQGPLSITVHVLGVVEKNHVLRRDAAKPGDAIYVTGTLGDAACALDALNAHQIPLEPLRQRLDYPTPRVQAGVLLGGIAHAAIDISDGLLADLGHILKRSHVGATLLTEQIPLSVGLQQMPREQALAFALTGGDDYELCFTVSPEKEATLNALFSKISCNASKIGTICAESGLYLQNHQGRQRANLVGYEHFI